MNGSLKFKVRRRRCSAPAPAPQPPCRGLGDAVARVAEATGMARAAQWFERATGRPCGCEERREALNKMFPFGPSGGH